MKSNRHSNSTLLPFEGGWGNIFEIIDMMCTVTETMASIIREQEMLIEQEGIAGSITDELRRRKTEADNMLDSIEFKLRRM